MKREFLGSTRVSTGYQITVPRDLRKYLGIKRGDKILFWLEGDKIVLEKV